MGDHAMMETVSNLSKTLKLVDDYLSAPLFWTQLSPILTWIYACPACFFGLPGVIAGPLLVLAGCCTETVPVVWKAWTACLVSAYVICFYVLMNGVFYSDTPEKAAVSKAWSYKFFDLYFSLSSGCFVLAYQIHPEGIYPMQLYCLCTIATQSVIFLLKRKTGRVRPCLRTFPHPLPKRVVPLSMFVSDVKHSVESFPSGDAAQSVIFFATIFTMGASVYWIGLVLLSATGRVFFHAHHAFDVISGMLIAAAGCSAVVYVFKEPIHWFTLIVVVGGGLLYIKVPKYNHGDGKKNKKAAQ